MKSLAEGVALRSHILRCFEGAVNEGDPTVRRRKLTFVIVGGGATGVEFAGALAELIRGPLARDFPRLNLDQVWVQIVEACAHVLPGMSPRLRQYTCDQLRKKGVEIRLNSPATRVTIESVELAGGEITPAETVVWTSGVRGDPRIAAWGLPVTRVGRVPVAATLQVPGHPNVYVVGDLASIGHEGRSFPLTAPVATQEGLHAARNILRPAVGNQPERFCYREVGSMVTMGRNAAVARVGGRDFTGVFAWLLWVITHIFKLIGFRNWLQVLINWAWDYILYERAVCLIMPWGPECGSHRGNCKLLR